MPNPLELDFDPITTDRRYIRWLGDRKQIEAQTMTSDKAIVDHTAEQLKSWVHFCCQIMKRGVFLYAYANHHFQGRGLYAARTRNGFVPASRRRVFEKLTPLVVAKCRFVNLPETRKARWGEALTAEKMKKCVWVRLPAPSGENISHGEAD
jgi:hypothetical protein